MTRRTTLLAFLMFFAFAVVLQAWHGAYSAEFSGNPDEPAHYVTGVMVRDYLASFPWHPPMPFARDFYDHYPIVAIGHWPKFDSDAVSANLTLVKRRCHGDSCFSIYEVQRGMATHS